MSARYAIYYTPALDSTLARFGARWLGRDAATDTDLEQPALDGLSPERLTAITAAPRRYGFHATLKAPFVLAAGGTAEALQSAAAAFAAGRRPFTAPPLTLGCLDGFVALMLADPCPDMDRLAADCVTHFDPFRAPLSAADRARRRATGLDGRQAELLERWGYPFVMERFRFHMTLTDRLEPAERDRVLAALRPLVSSFIDMPLAVDAIAIYRQPAASAPFRLLSRHRFTG